MTADPILRRAATGPDFRRPPADRLGHLVGAVGGGSTLDEHLRTYGPVPYLGPDNALAELAAAAGLTGRGGAAFPTARKLAAVGSRRRAVVVANGAEGEPASAKDRTLLDVRPNLVLDGLQLAGEAVGARRLVLYLHRDAELAASLRWLIADRRRRGLDQRDVEIVEAPHRFLAGEESALAARVSGGPALPRFTPPRVFESGVDGAPTLVQNVETLAQLALLARYGDAWFRSAGTAAEPGTMLATIHTVRGRQVLEVPLGTPVTTVLVDPLNSGGATGAVLVGGYHGAWLRVDRARDARLANADLRPLGAAVGAGVLAALPRSACGLVETARVVRYLAGESAGQCGPCLNGLPAIAHGLDEIAGARPRQATVANVQRWSGLVEGRGACHHPDGTVRLVRSALAVFADEVVAHQRGMCTGTDHAPFLPVPRGLPTTDADWV